MSLHDTPSGPLGSHGHSHGGGHGAHGSGAHGAGSHGGGSHSHGGHGSHGSHGLGGHGHSHAPADFGRAFLIGISLNIGFVIIEAGFGFAANSTALLADAGHNLSDVLSLVIAWAAAVAARRPATPRFTYGLGPTTILAALLNALLLLLAVGGIAWEAVTRLSSPEPVAGGIVAGVAAAGILVNGFTAWLFFAGRKDDINIRGAYLHMAADAAVSAGVVLSGLAIMVTGWTWLDPVTSLVIVAVIAIGTWGLLRDSVVLSLHAVPPSIDPVAVHTLLAAQPGVVALHALHIWPTSTTSTALTVHLCMPAGHPGDAELLRIVGELRDRFGIRHATLQVETDPENGCPHTA